jgi:hypothetical protein
MTLLLCQYKSTFELSHPSTARMGHPRLSGLMQREKLASGAEQAAEKVKSSEKNCEIHPSAAKAGVNPIDLSARVNSCPFKTALGTSFSAACEALTDFDSLDARAEARTLQLMFAGELSQGFTLGYSHVLPTGEPADCSLRFGAKHAAEELNPEDSVGQHFSRWGPKGRCPDGVRGSGLRVGLDYASYFDGRQTGVGGDVGHSVGHDGIGKFPGGGQDACAGDGSDA